MKKTLIFLALLSALLSAVPSGAVAYALTETPHVVVSAPDTYLLSESGEKLFLLPESYYAEITNMDLEYYHVTFNGLSGKVLRSAVSTVSYHAQAPGSVALLAFSQASMDFDAISLKKSPDQLSAAVVSVPTSASLTFIGKYPTEGALWYYVRYGLDYGYVKAAHTKEPDLLIAAFVPEERPAAPVSAEPDAVTPESSDITIPVDLGGNALRVLLIAGICIPAVLLVFLVFRPRRARRSG